jgi:hypothetical protein
MIFALAQAVFGHNQWGIRVVDLVGIGVSAWLVAKVVRHYTAPGVGHWAAALLVLWFGGLTFWHTASPTDSPQCCSAASSPDGLRSQRSRVDEARVQVMLEAAVRDSDAEPVTRPGPAA